ncbi:MAG: hypothetical protein EBT05_02735 [Betaproteobacteria bacterium]|nr:hypothetical protein [Betaproteobacteria bacterium]
MQRNALAGLQQQQAKLNPVARQSGRQRRHLHQGGVQMVAGLHLRRARDREPRRVFPVLRGCLWHCSCSTVARQDLRLARGQAGKVLADHTSHRAVAASAIAFPERFIGGVLHQRMPEVVMHVPPHRGLRQNAGAHERFQVKQHPVQTHRGVGVGKYGLHHGLRKAAPDNAAKLGHGLGGVQAVQACHQQILHFPRYGDGA